MLEGSRVTTGESSGKRRAVLDLYRRADQARFAREQYDVYNVSSRTKHYLWCAAQQSESTTRRVLTGFSFIACIAALLLWSAAWQ